MLLLVHVSRIHLSVAFLMVCFSVRQKTFHVDCNTYSRCEVVAMEWLVQEVLNFQCFLPTIYNFLWYFLSIVTAVISTLVYANICSVYM